MKMKLNKMDISAIRLLLSTSANYVRDLPQYLEPDGYSISSQKRKKFIL